MELRNNDKWGEEKGSVCAVEKHQASSISPPSALAAPMSPPSQISWAVDSSLSCELFARTQPDNSNNGACWREGFDACFCCMGSMAMV